MQLADAGKEPRGRTCDESSVVGRFNCMGKNKSQK